MFSKDLLIIDLETTGLDLDKHEIIQIAAVLLDRKTLKEKASFSSFVKPKDWDKRDPEAMAVNKISFSALKGAPTLAQVVKKFNKEFKASEVITANYGGILDFTFLRAAYKKNGLRYPFDYHVFNIWPLCYSYIAQNGKFTSKKKFPGFGLEDLAKKFKLSAQTHNALDDCRLEAEVLRKIIKKI